MSRYYTCSYVNTANALRAMRVIRRLMRARLFWALVFVVTILVWLCLKERISVARTTARAPSGASSTRTQQNTHNRTRDVPTSDAPSSAPSRTSSVSPTASHAPRIIPAATAAQCSDWCHWHHFLGQKCVRGIPKSAQDADNVLSVLWSILQTSWAALTSAITS